MGPRYRTPIWDPVLGQRFGTPIWDPNLVLFAPDMVFDIWTNGWQTWPAYLADLAGRLGRQTWPTYLAGRLGRQTWLADLAGRLGWQTWPVRLVKIKDGLKIEDQHCFI
jgi:hypothetical protein